MSPKKVIAIDGSPLIESNTRLAINAAAAELLAAGIETEVIKVGDKLIKGCQGCGACWTKGECAISDCLNEIAMKMRAADGIIIGSPVYYAAINGTLKSFLDRTFYSSSAHFRFKPAGAVVVARRGGTTAALQTINQYFEIAEMLITPSIYWN